MKASALIKSKPSSLRISWNQILFFSLILLTFSAIYVVGFEPLPLVHNAFHDVRHATGFPCH